MKRWLLLWMGLALIFKNVTQYEVIGNISKTLKEGKWVDALVMRKGSRNLIEYGGTVTGDQASLISTVEKFAGEKFKVESNQKEGMLEILVTPQTP